MWAVTRLLSVRLLSVLLQSVRLLSLLLLSVRLLSVLLQRVRLLSLPKHQHVGAGVGAVRSCVAFNSLIVNILNMRSGAENMTGLYGLSVDSQNVVCHGIFHYLCP